MFEKIYFMVVWWWYLLKSDFSMREKIYFLWKSFLLTIGDRIYNLLGINHIYIWKWLYFYWFNASFVSWLFHENRIHNEYYFNSQRDNPIIIDAWANIWDSMLYFKYLYPKSTIYSFEPDKVTFKMLENNVVKNKLTDVFYYNAAIWSSNQDIEFYFDDVPSYTHSTKIGRMSKNKTKVQCFDIVSFIGDKYIDLLKLDIEGGEWDVLTALDNSWSFNQIEQIVLEYHHNIVWEDSMLWWFLWILEKNWFDYQIQSSCFPMNELRKYQDVHIFAYKK